MSNQLSIAAVTATLRNILARVSVPLATDTDTALSDTQVTTLPPDKCGLTDDHNQINLFLYHVSPNLAARNLDGQGLAGKPPGLALDLFYMVTVYGAGSSDILAQRLLGRAMSLLHSYPTLSPTDIAAALSGANLGQQSERVRVLPHDISNEEMVRLWGTFQVKYRLSVVYRVAVVLIDHEVAVTSATAVKGVAVTVYSSTASAAGTAT
jgi:hypothetical protein